MDYKEFEKTVEKYKKIEDLVNKAIGFFSGYYDIKRARDLIGLYECLYELNFKDSDYFKDYVKDTKTLCTKINEQILKLLPTFEK